MKDEHVHIDSLTIVIRTDRGGRRSSGADAGADAGARRYALKCAAQAAAMLAGMAAIVTVSIASQWAI